MCSAEDDGSQRVLTLGLKESFEKDAAGVARTFTTVLDDVEATYAELRGPAAAKEVRIRTVMALSNTMSDRGSAAFPSDVEAELGVIEAEIRQLPQTEQIRMMEVCNFFCNDHFLHTMATDIMSAIGLCQRSWWKGPGATMPFGAGSELDEAELQGLGIEKDEALKNSTTELFIREASKGLSPVGACEKSGKPSGFRGFVERVGGAVPVENAHLVYFRGSRFGAVFDNGEGWHGLLPQVLAFLEELRHVDGGLNRLLFSIPENARWPEVQAALQVSNSFSLL